MNNSSFFKKSKNFNPLEYILGILGFIFSSVFFFSCFLYFDYWAITYHEGSLLSLARLPISSSPGSGSATAAAAAAALSSSERPGFLDKGGEGCDIFDGYWAWDDSYPLYQSTYCLFIDNGFRCLENGRPDHFYTKWRWQPKDCDLPRFDAKEMLDKLRNRRLVFVGDSIGRNQWESLLCMLSSAVPNKSSIYEVNGNPISKHKGFLAFMFKDYNCTVEYYRVPHIVVQGRPPAKAPPEVKMTLRVDQLSWTYKQWRDADVLIFNTGHWWTYQKTIRLGIYFQEGDEVKMNMTVEDAFRRSIENMINLIGTEVNMTKTQVFFRTIAPSHFRGSSWNSGGYCHLERLPEFGSLADSFGVKFDIVSDVLSNQSNESQIKNLDLLNITGMTARRKDGHASLYNQKPDSGPKPHHIQDCSHWCLPGVPDSWNELVYALFLKQESARR